MGQFNQYSDGVGTERKAEKKDLLGRKSILFRSQRVGGSVAVCPAYCLTDSVFRI